MSRSAPIALLLLAGCATAPGPSSTEQRLPGPPVAHQRGALIGLSAAELVQRFGQPALRVREGPGLKLQFASTSCVLDAYLYPPTGGPAAAAAERVTHVDARRPTGEDVAQAECLASLSAR